MDVRAVFSIAAVKKWPLYHIDVHNVFLPEELSEEVYMRMPPGFQRKCGTCVCHLNKSVYGLRQYSCEWFAKIVSALIDEDFINMACKSISSNL